MEAVRNNAPFLVRVFMRVSRAFDRARVRWLLSRVGSCGEGVSIQWPVVINGPDHLTLGKDVSINAFVHIWAQGGVSIGESSLIASHVAITSLTHFPEADRFSESLVSKPISIGKNVWIGAHAVILPGVTIGDGAIVGAGAVVTSDVGAGTTVVGVPAKPIRRSTS